MFNKNIILLRKRKNITQEELAKALSVSRQTISKWEKGEVVPDSYNLIEISKYFSIKAQDLIMTDLSEKYDVKSGVDELTEKVDVDIKEKTQIDEFIDTQDNQNTKIKSSKKKIILILVLIVGLISIIFSFKDQLFGSKNEVIIDEPIQEPEETLIDYSKLLSAGREFSVYIDQNGKLIGFGDNTYKQLNFENWSDIVQISAGGFHTLGLKSDGTVVATGYNNFKQIDVGSWSNIKQVSGGRYHSLGLKEDGTVLCVGENQYGACNVSSWADIIQVSAGRYNSYGLKSDGTVVSTENDDYGQADISSWADITQVSAGTYHVIGLKNDGSVVCVGGQKGDGVCNISSWTDIKQVVGAGYHSIGLRNDGTVVAVGNNEKGQLDVSGWKDVVAVSGGRYHTIGLTKDNTFLSLGLDESKQSNNNSDNTGNIENNNQEGMTKYRMIGSDSYTNMLINSEGNNISNINYLADQYRIEFKSKAKTVVLKIATIEGIEYISFFNISDYKSDIKYIDIYEELLKVLYADQNTHEKQILKLSLSERDDNPNIEEFTNWKDLTYKFNAKEEFSDLFLEHGQVEIVNDGYLQSIYPGKLDISQFKSGADLDLSDGFDYAYLLNEDGLNLETVLSEFDPARGTTNIPDNFELGKTFYLCNSVFSIDGTGALMYSGDKLITNCDPFRLDSIRFGLKHYYNAPNYGEVNFFYAQDWMNSKADSNFEIEIIAKDINYINVFEKSLNLTNKGFIINVIDEMKKDIVVDDATPDKFTVNINVTAKGVGKYLKSLPFQFQITLKKSDFTD